MNRTNRKPTSDANEKINSAATLFIQICNNTSTTQCSSRQLLGVIHLQFSLLLWKVLHTLTYSNSYCFDCLIKDHLPSML